MQLKNYCATLFLILCFMQSNCFAQKGDSISTSQIVTWQVKQNKGLFGLAKPSFGTYSTIDISKIDSAGFKRKRKDSSYAGADISREGTDFDISKFMTIEKTKFYKLRLANTADTIEAKFAIASTSHEKKQTFLGKVISKNDEGKDEVLDKTRNLVGEIDVNTDEQKWDFFIDSLISTQSQALPFDFLPVQILSSGFLKNKTDSFNIQNVSAGIIGVDINNETIATLSFRKKRPEIQIQHNTDKSIQEVIAGMFAVIIAVKDYQ